MTRIYSSSPSNEASQHPPPTRPPSPSAPAPLRALRRTATQRLGFSAMTRGTPLPPVLTVPIEVVLEAKSESPSPVVHGDPADWPPEVLERVMAQIDAQIEARRAAEASSRRALVPPSSPVLDWDIADLPPHELAGIMSDLEITMADVQRSPSPADTGTPPPSSESDIDTPPPPRRPLSTALCDIPAEDLNLVLASFGAATTPSPRPSTPQIVRDISNYSDEEVHQLMMDIGMIPGTPPTPRTSPRTVQEAGEAVIRALHHSGMITPARSPTTSSTAALRSTLAPTSTPLSVRTRGATSTSLATPLSSPPRPSASVSTPTPASSRPYHLRGPADTFFEDGIPDLLRDWFRNEPMDQV